MTECIFCKISAGQINVNVVYDDPRVMAFRDINPQAPVHILIIPKIHVARISELSEDQSSVLLDVHKALLAVVKQEKLSEAGFRLTTNDGKDAGQTVHHLHFHLLAGRRMSWPPG